MLYALQCLIYAASSETCSSHHPQSCIKASCAIYPLHKSHVACVICTRAMSCNLNLILHNFPVSWSFLLPCFLGLIYITILHILHIKQLFKIEPFDEGNFQHSRPVNCLALSSCSFRDLHTKNSQDLWNIAQFFLLSHVKCTNHCMN